MFNSRTQRSISRLNFGRPNTYFMVLEFRDHRAGQISGLGTRLRPGEPFLGCAKAALRPGAAPTSRSL